MFLILFAPRAGHIVCPNRDPNSEQILSVVDGTEPIWNSLSIFFVLFYTYVSSCGLQAINVLPWKTIEWPNRLSSAS
jgi:hypothetical protein